MAANSIYQKPKGRSAKKKEKEKLIITKIYKESPALTYEESEALNDILEDNSNVFYKKRPVQETIISGGEKWELLFEDKEHYQYWLYYNRLSNKNYTAGELDQLFNIFGEE